MIQIVFAKKKIVIETIVMSFQGSGGPLHQVFVHSPRFGKSHSVQARHAPQMASFPEASIPEAAPGNILLKKIFANFFTNKIKC